MKLLHVPPRDPARPWLEDRAPVLRRYAALYAALLLGLLVLDRYNLGPAKYRHLRTDMDWPAAFAQMGVNALWVAAVLAILYAWHARHSRTSNE